VCAVAAAVTLALGGCTPGRGELPRDALERQAARQIGELAGTSPPVVACEGPLAKRRGSQQRCRATSAMHVWGFTVIAEDFNADDSSLRISIMADRPV